MCTGSRTSLSTSRSGLGCAAGIGLGLGAHLAEHVEAVLDRRGVDLAVEERLHAHQGPLVITPTSPYISLYLAVEARLHAHQGPLVITPTSPYISLYLAVEARLHAHGAHGDAARRHRPDHVVVRLRLGEREAVEHRGLAGEERGGGVRLLRFRFRVRVRARVRDRGW